MQRAAAVVLAVILLFFVFAVGTAVISYSGLIKATQQIDQHWEAIQQIEHARQGLLKKIEAPEAQKPLVANLIKSSEALANVRVDPAHAPVFDAQMAEYKKAFESEQKLLIEWVELPQPASPLLSELQQQLRQQNLQRAQYNQQVHGYNQRIQTFPVSLVSGILGFGPRPAF